MKDFRTSGICQAKKGLLFLRDCGAPATANCHLCGRPICETHSIEDEMKYICPECFTQKDTSGQSKPNVKTRTGLGAMSRYRTRHHYYSRYSYFPYYYGSSHYYSDRDYRTFETSQRQRKPPAKNRPGPRPWPAPRNRIPEITTIWKISWRAEKAVFKKTGPDRSPSVRPGRHGHRKSL